jgi:hypothetical protein
MAKVSNDHRLSEEDLKAHLDEQLGFLERSADSYDSGFDGEAKRLAVTLRVLLHDTARSRSLLAQLNMKGMDFVDTAGEPSPGNLVPEHNLIAIETGSGPPRYVPLLDGPYTGLVPFERWWNAQVFIDQEKRCLSRRDLVLTAANKDGGAHVDSTLSATYAALSRQNSLGYHTHPTHDGKALQNPERAAIRQIAHEIIKTLRPGYSKEQKASGALFSRMYVSTEPPPGFPGAGPQPPLSRQQRRAQERQAKKKDA